MKAVIYKKYGSPEVLSLKECEKPTPKDNELLVKVYAATVNRTDCAMRSAKPFIMRFFTGLFKPKNPILGTDFAGRVISTGKAVTQFKSGDRIFGFNDMGVSSHAEYLSISEDNDITDIPKDISFSQAAASIEGAHYAINTINKVTISAGQKVLINGGTGAIGSACAQILIGTTDVDLTVVCKGKHRDLMKSLGIQKIIDYEKEDFTQSQEQYDFVFDLVGKSTFGKCKPILTKKGIYISSELGPYSQNIFYALFTPLLGGKKVIFPVPVNRRASVDLIQRLMEEKKFDPIIDRTYPLEEIRDAYRYVERGEKVGNVVLSVNEYATHE